MLLVAPVSACIHHSGCRVVYVPCVGTPTLYEFTTRYIIYGKSLNAAVKCYSNGLSLSSAFALPSHRTSMVDKRLWLV